MSTHGRHRASRGKGSGKSGSHRRSHGVIFSVFEIIIMILFGTLGVLMVLLAHSVKGRRHDQSQRPGPGAQQEADHETGGPQDRPLPGGTSVGVSAQ